MAVHVRLPRLDLYDVAFLAGGTRRVVDTALVVLIRDGRVRVRSAGHLVTAGLSRRHPVEAAVLDAVGPLGHRSVDTVCWRLAEDDRVLDVGRRLREAGLLGRVGALSLLRRGHRSPTPTRLGRRVLREVGRQPSTGDPEATRVALGGRSAMDDQRLRAEIFERPGTSLRPARPGRRSRDVDHSDPRLAAYRRAGRSSVAGGYVSIDGGAP
ncbi:TIGR04222 domain-containing membrane protein [Geodermatophilus sp. SYSU D00708]